MTTLYEKKVRCAVCGTETGLKGIGSTNTFGLPDLDTRPPEMRRSTIFAWVQQCPECGYCSSDVSKAPLQASSLIQSPEYRRQLTDSTCPKLANGFSCKALIDAGANDFASATWALIHAAWACDDAKKPDAAKTCRSKAADMMLKAIENGQEIAKQEGAETAIRVDLLRRAGRHAEARQLIATKGPAITEDIISKILAFQDALLGKDDEACHTISEALRRAD